jgi:hypothetical protein
MRNYSIKPVSFDILKYAKNFGFLPFVKRFEKIFYRIALVWSDKIINSHLCLIRGGEELGFGALALGKGGDADFGGFALIGVGDACLAADR